MHKLHRTANKFHFLLSLTTCSDQWLLGTQQVAWLHFTTVATQRSTFVTLELDNTVGLQPDGTPVRNFAAQAGRLVIIAEEPLLEAVTGTNDQPILILYGQPGWSCVIQFTSDLTKPIAWNDGQEIQLTELVTVMGPMGVIEGARFYRAMRRH